MIPADETFDGTWPYAPNFFDGNGFRQHYVDVNNADADNLPSRLQSCRRQRS